MQNANVVVRRAQIARWSSYLGATALLVGGVGTLLFSGVSLVTLALMIGGVLGLAAWVVLNPKEARDVVSGRQVQYTTSAFFSTLLLIGIVSLVYVLVLRSTITLDMTLANRYTLSSETRQFLNTLNRPIQITGFYSASNLNQREIDDQFYRQYAAVNSNIRIVYIDPQEQPAVASSFGVSQDGAMFVSLLNDDGTVDLESLTPVIPTNQQERDMTTALARLLLRGRFVIYFVTSGGTLDPQNNLQQGLSLFNADLQEIGYITQPLDLTQVANSGGSIPQNASVVILPRPTNDLTSAELTVLDAYLGRGGALLILADILFNENTFLGQNSLFNTFLWDRYGIRGLDAVIVEQLASAQTQLDIYAGAVFVDIPLAEGIDPQTDPNSSTLFHLTRALEVNDVPPANINNGRAIMSSAESYGETDLNALATTTTFFPEEGEDLDPPLTSVAWARSTLDGSAVVLMGDGDFATNGYYSRGTGNSRLLLNSVGWLSGFIGLESVSFAPNAISVGLPTSFVSIGQLDAVAFVTVIVFPSLVLLAGAIIWRRRVSER